MAKTQYFSEKDIEDIKLAVSRAEEKTSGEIVPYFVERSDTYEEAKLRSALVFSGFALLSMSVLSLSWNFIIHISATETVLATLGTGFLGYLAPHFLKNWRRYLISPEGLRNRVRQRALEAFVSEEVFNTQNRTGILIFISYFERRVEVIGDEGINRKVGPEQWSGVVMHIIQGIKSKKMVEGIIQGIDDCGELLKNAKVDRLIDDSNELDDGLRME